MKSPIKWMGSKAKLAEEIVKLFPQKFNTYYEPFFGSGAVFFTLKPENSYCSDLMVEPIAVVNAIKRDPKIFFTIFKKLSDNLFEKSEKYYYEIRDIYNNNKELMDDFNRGAYFLFLLRAGFNGVIRFNSKKNNSWNVPYGRRGAKDNKNIKLYSESFLDDLIEYSKFLNIGNKVFQVEDFVKAIDKASKSDLIYCDPPYTETSSNKRYNMSWNKESDIILHNALIAAKERGAFFVLSNVYTYKGVVNNFIIDLYKSFNTKIIKHEYIVGPKSKTRQKVEELLIY